jgi:hypothetical protein
MIEARSFDCQELLKERSHEDFRSERTRELLKSRLERSQEGKSF